MWWGPTSMTKNHDRKWAFHPGRAETRLHDILWAFHDGKNHGRNEGEENIGEFLVTVGGRGPSDARCSHTRTRVGARRWALTKPERGVRLLNPSDCTVGYALLNPSDRSIWLLAEPDQAIPSLLLLTEADRTCCLLMSNGRCWGFDEQLPMGVG